MRERRGFVASYVCPRSYRTESVLSSPKGASMPGILPPQSTARFHWLPLDTHLALVAGDDCKAADGRALYWTSPSWPNLAGAALSMVVGTDAALNGPTPATWTGVVSPVTPSPSTVALELTSAQTAVLLPGMYAYTLTAALVDGDKITVAVGNLTVQAAPGTTPLYR